MKRFEMIKDKKYFNHIIRNCRYVKDNVFVIYYNHSYDENHFSHFGIAVKNSIGNAVTRNRLKRQVRSIIDKNKKMFKKDFDYIIMIRKGCLEKNFNSMNESMINLMKGIKQ